MCLCQGRLRWGAVGEIRIDSILKIVYTLPLTFGKEYIMTKYANLVGHTFGRLTVVSRAENISNRIAYTCSCSCGGSVTTIASSLIRGATTSCGCYREEFRRLPEGEAAFNDLLYSYKWGAKKKGRSFELTKEEFKALTKSPCTYCGTPPLTVKSVKKATNGTYLYNGVDRKDNSLGYTVANTQPCCGICNQAKHTLTEDQFLNWVDRISTFQRNKHGT